MKGVTEKFPKKLKKGDVIIEPFELKEIPWRHNYNVISDGFPEGVIGRTGKFVRMIVDGEKGAEVMMSDTPMELKTNKEFCDKAHGHILIAGLGIGLLLNNILHKKEVLSVTIIEVNPNVISLVAKKYKDKRVTVIEGDIDTWVPPIEAVYDCIYFDIWPTVSTDNLPHITALHRKFRKYLNKRNPNNYMGSWVRDILRRRRRRGY